MDTPADQILIAAEVGDEVVTDTIAVTRDGALRLHLPGDQFVKYGSELRFQAAASDPAASVSVSSLLPGAAFDAATGEFRWTPDATQIGMHAIDFTATGPTGEKSIASVKIQVDSGEPVLTRIVNAASRSSEPACSPGAIASVQGRWFLNGAPASDLSGVSEELAGAKVLINGTAAPLVSGADSELNFLCPNAVPGSVLEVAVQTDHGITAALRTTARAAAPGLFSIDGSGGGQAAALLEDGSSLAMVRNYRFASEPATAGSRVTLYATGISELTAVRVQVGETEVTPDSITSAPGHPGVSQVVLTVPQTLHGSGSLPLVLLGDTTDGIRVSTNIVNIAVEGDTRYDQDDL